MGNMPTWPLLMSKFGFFDGHLGLHKLGQGYLIPITKQNPNWNINHNILFLNQNRNIYSIRSKPIAKHPSSSSLSSRNLQNTQDPSTLACCGCRSSEVWLWNRLGWLYESGHCRGGRAPGLGCRIYYCVGCCGEGWSEERPMDDWRQRIRRWAWNTEWGGTGSRLWMVGSRAKVVKALANLAKVVALLRFVGAAGCGALNWLTTDDNPFIFYFFYFLTNSSGIEN